MSGWVAGATVVSAGISGYMGMQQAKAGAKAMKDPREKDRKVYAGQLKEMLATPENFFQNPLYQSAFGQGRQATMRGLASEGFLGSGNFATGLQSYGQSFGMGMFMEYSKYLAELAGFSHFTDPAAGLQSIDAGYGRIEGALGQLGAGFGTAFGKMGGASGTPASPGMSPGTGNFVGPR